MPYIHRISGRLRVRSHAVKQDPDSAGALRSMLERRPGITSVEINPVTGSVLIRYSAGVVDSDMLLDTLREWGFVSEAIEEPRRTGRKKKPEVRQSIAAGVVDAAIKTAIQTAVERSVFKLISGLL